jgi:phage tail-like protein
LNRRVAVRFQVRWDNQTLIFQDVLGLDVAGTARTITLKNGRFAGTTPFRDWLRRLQASSRRVPLTVSRVDDLNRPTTVWTISGAFPAKVTGPELNAAANDVAIETLEITCDGVTVG